MDSYRIVRYFARKNRRKSDIVKTGLTLRQAQEHCQREDTEGDGWFDGYELENPRAEHNERLIQALGRLRNLGL